MSEEYTIAEISGHKPKYEVDKDNHFYCDGVKVEKWQLTPEELKLWFPKEFEAKYGEYDCPYSGCTMKVNGKDGGKAPFIGHLRQTHTPFYEAHKAEMSGLEGFQALFDYVKSTFKPADEPRISME